MIADTLQSVTLLRRARLAVGDVRWPGAARRDEWQMVEDIIAAAHASANCSSAPPVADRLMRTNSGVIVARLRPVTPAGAPLILKIATTPDADRCLRRHAAAITHLHESDQLVDIRQLVPVPIASGDCCDRSWVIETALPGLSAQICFASAATLRWLQRHAIDTMVGLYERTLTPKLVDSTVFEQLAGRHLRRLGEVALTWPDGDAARHRVDALASELRRELVGRVLPLAQTHGDFWPGNLLVSYRNRTITGILDWDAAIADDLPLVDVYHILVSPVAMLRQYAFGEVIRERLLLGGLSAEDRHLLDSVSKRLGLPTDADFRRAAALLFWVRFVTDALDRRSERRSDPHWLGLNVWPVLTLFAPAVGSTLN